MHGAAIFYFRDSFLLIMVDGFEVLDPGCGFHWSWLIIFLTCKHNPTPLVRVEALGHSPSAKSKSISLLNVEDSFSHFSYLQNDEHLLSLKSGRLIFSFFFAFIINGNCH